MPILDFSDSASPRRRSQRGNLLSRLLGVGALIGVIVLGSTFAASINLNSGTAVEFGQGVVATTACDDDGITLTPQATFINNGDDSDFLFTMLTVTDVSSNCDGKSFTIKAYKNGQNSALALYETNGTTYYEININDVAGIFSFGDGGLESGDIQDIDTGFYMTIGAGIQPSVALASAQDVDRITIESRDTGETDSVIEPNSLVALYKFENAGDLGLDTAGNINISGVQGAPSQTEGQIGSAIYFDGNSYLNQNGEILGLPSGNSSYTFSAWINADEGAPGTGGIVSYGLSETSKCNCLRLNGLDGIWHYWYDNDFWFSSGPLLVGSWHHIASTYDAATGFSKLYLDGLLQYQEDRSDQLPNFYGGNLFIGRTNADVAFKGKIDEIAIYNYALDSQEIVSVRGGNY